MILFNVHLKFEIIVGLEVRIKWLDLLFVAQFKDHTNTHLEALKLYTVKATNVASFRD